MTETTLHGKTRDQKPSTLRVWLLAARPKTLSGALLPVAVATALAGRDDTLRPSVALWCATFALLMQVAANFINDLFDFLQGTDNGARLGPERACAQGWITPLAMRRGIILVVALAAVVGLAAVGSNGAWTYHLETGLHIEWNIMGWCVVLGGVCIIFAFLYTTLLSYCGGGDLLVYVFFGLVPVLGTYFLQTLQLTPAAWWAAAACGLVTDTLLLVNNYRDYESDSRSGKRTLVVLFGKRFGSGAYLLHGLLATGAALMTLLPHGLSWILLLPLAYLPAHFYAWRTMTRLHQGHALNRILGMTSLNLLLFSLLFCATLWLQTT